MYLTIFGKPRYLGLVVAEDGMIFEKGEQILVESSRGVEIAVVAGEITERQEGLYRSIDNRQEGQPSNDSGLQNIAFIGRVNDSDLIRERENREDEDVALVTARQVLSRHSLDMKLVDVEYMHDRKKLFLYFTSEQRVDFRAYVRDLAREFRTRIELRQIGVRDESKVVKGIGACGRVCCCSYWLQRFMPIGIKMVKEQNLALNPTKISGLCGRLMCCMSFEQDNYRDLWKKLPSHGAKIKTEQGTWILTGVDLASKSCTIHGPNGNITVPVDQYQRFKETILSGENWEGVPITVKKTGNVPKDQRNPDENLFHNNCSECQGCPQPPSETETTIVKQTEAGPLRREERSQQRTRRDVSSNADSFRKPRMPFQSETDVSGRDEGGKLRDHNRRNHGQKRISLPENNEVSDSSPEMRKGHQRGQRRRFPARDSRKSITRELDSENVQRHGQEEMR